jgi:tetratricopeptide (TPR) repeat protein
MGRIEIAFLGEEDPAKEDKIYKEWRRELREAFLRDRGPRPAGLPKDHLDDGAGSVRTEVIFSNIPLRLPRHFFGREESLSAIRDALSNSGNTIAIAALYGLRGVGKSVLAAAYAQLHGDNYRVKGWIRAQSDFSMRADLVAIGKRLGWIDAGEKEEVALEKVLIRLREDGEGVLLIYDNASDANILKSYLPTWGKMHALITSNNHAWRSIASPIEIPVWRKEIGARFLIARSGRHQDPHWTAEALSDALGGLPLAHEMAGAFCERDISFLDYKNRFDAEPVEFMDLRRDAPSEYGLTVAKAFSLAIQEATKLHPAAELVMVYAAMLAPEPIPTRLLFDNCEYFGEPGASSLDSDGIGGALSALRAFSLIQREEMQDELQASITVDVIRIHRLVREIARSRRTTIQKKEIVARLMAAIESEFPYDEIQNPNVWPMLRRLVPLTEFLVENENELQELAPVRSIKLLSYVVSYYYQIEGSYKRSRILAEEALRRSLKYLGIESNYSLHIINELAIIYRELGNLDEAEELLLRGIEASVSYKGEHHFLTANLIAGLANILDNKGMYQQAREVYEQAIELFEEVYGDDASSTVMLTGAYALVLFELGDFVNATELAMWSKDVLDDRLGRSHPSAIAHRQSLERILNYSYKDRTEKKEQYVLQLEEQERQLGRGHPDTIETMMLMGNLEMDDGHEARAVETYSKALARAEVAYDEKHPIVLKLKRLISGSIN